MRAEHLTSTLVSRNTLFNVQSYNQAASKNSPIVRDADGNKRRDVASISPMQRAASMIKSLQKQKQSILDAKRELVETNSNAGKDIEEIRTQLDSYNELLNNLDEQVNKVIADLAIEEANKLEELKDKLEEKLKESGEIEAPKTEEEIFADRMGDLAQADASLDEAERLSSIKRMAGNRSEIVKSEIEFDGSLSGAAPAVGKRSELRQINQYMNALDNDITRAVKDVNRSIDEIKEEKEAIKDNDKDGVEDTPVLDGTAPPEEDSDSTTKHAAEE